MLRKNVKEFFVETIVTLKEFVPVRFALNNPVQRKISILQIVFLQKLAHFNEHIILTRQLGEVTIEFTSQVVDFVLQKLAADKRIFFLEFYAFCKLFAQGKRCFNACNEL